MTLVKKVPFFRDIQPQLLERVSKPTLTWNNMHLTQFKVVLEVPEKDFRMHVFEYSKIQNQQPMLEM